MKLILATDHAGFEMKEHIKRYLASRGYIVEDVGAHSFNPTDDYPDYIHEAAQKISRGFDGVGIFFGGSGQGEAMVANRYSGVRAMVYTAPDPDLVVLGREHNDANVLSIGARFLSDRQAEQAVESFLGTPFPGESRHVRRVGRIDR